jgi:hypothetical protein
VSCGSETAFPEKWIPGRGLMAALVRKRHISSTSADRVPYYGSVSCIFRDFQDDNNALNGTVIDSRRALSELLESFRDRQPFLFELREDPGFTLTIGFSDECGCVQFARSDGEPPYEMAVWGPAPEGSDKSVWFLAGDQPAEIAAKFCMPIEQVRDIATHFVAGGGKSPTVSWEEV